jgi:hypothetical protein
MWDESESEYSDETISKANNAFWLGENGKDNFCELKYASDKGYKYSLLPYAYWLLNNNGDSERACECLLMAAFKRAITSGDDLYKFCVEPLKLISSEYKTVKRKWVRGDYLFSKRPKSIQDAINLLRENVRGFDFTH